MTSLASTDQVLARFAAEVGDVGPISVEGERTRWDLGGRLDAAARVVRAPSGVVDYKPAEMIVTVRAGTLVSDLESELVAAGQRCALPSRGGTVGGAVVVGENHRDVLGRGTVSVGVLQIRYVSSDGQLVTGGGPVVKNVSGFNLPKLITGSLGTLGLVCEVVLRVNPIPAVSRWFAGPGDPVAAWGSVLSPSAVLWDGSMTWVHLEGHGPDVDAEALQLASISAFREVAEPPTLPPYRWSLAPSAIATLSGAETGGFVGSIGVGTTWANQPQPQLSCDPVAARIMARMKREFDPSGRLNPRSASGGAR